MEEDGGIEQPSTPPLPFGEDVAARVRAGDPDAVAEVYVALSDRLLSFLTARLGDRASAEDVLEATFIELLRKGRTIRGGPAAIKVWLFRSAHFNALDHLRKVGRRREDLIGDLVEVDVVDLERGPDELVEASELKAQVRAAMQELSDEQREVLLLRYVTGLTSVEVAEVMGKSPGAVRSLQHRGERSLHRLLEHLVTPATDQAPAASEERD